MFPNVVVGVLDEHLGDFRQNLLEFRGLRRASATQDQENADRPKRPGHKPAQQKLDDLAKADPQAFFPRWRRAALLSMCLQADSTGMTYNCLKGILPDRIIGQGKVQQFSKPVPYIDLDTVDSAFGAPRTMDLVTRMGL
jgi:hypothetical protein